MNYISTQQAADIVGCSKNHIHRLMESGQIKWKMGKLGKRDVYKVNKRSIEAYAKRNKNNKRIGREMVSREVQRRPINVKGYTYIYEPTHHRANWDGYVGEHILVMEKKLKRKLKKGEVVHHKNRERSDNRPSNLTVYKNQSEHMRLHIKLRNVLIQAQKRPDLEEAVIKFVEDWLK